MPIYTPARIKAMQQEHIAQFVTDSYLLEPLPRPAINDCGDRIGPNVPLKDHRTRYPVIGLMAIARK